VSVTELVFKEAGNVELIRQRDSARFLFVGMLDKITESTTIQKTKLNNGNGKFGRSYTTGAEAKVTLALNSYVPKFAEALKGATVTTGAGKIVRVIQPARIPSSAPYTVTLSKTPVADSEAVQEQDETPFDTGVTTPAVGEYVLAASVMTFNAADAGKYITIVYDTSVTGMSSTLAQDANSDAFTLTIAGKAVDAKNEGVSKVWSLTYNRVTVDGDIASPERSNTPTGWSVTFMVDDPPAGEEVYELAIES
jgi:hypothetical protein